MSMVQVSIVLFLPQMQLIHSLIDFITILIRKMRKPFVLGFNVREELATVVASGIGVLELLLRQGLWNDQEKGSSLSPLVIE